jgi:GNAT superfamily N-acetyltransferase
MNVIISVKEREHRDHVRELFWEYLDWANKRVNEEFHVDFDIKAMLEEDMENLSIFLPPNGRIFLTKTGDCISGIGCLKQSKEGYGEIKRMYVRPEFRGKGLGKLILNSLIQSARDIGFSYLRLDSARFMKEAHSLYKSMGFKDVDPYPESEIPDEFKSHWVFMQMKLS